MTLFGNFNSNTLGAALRIDCRVESIETGRPVDLWLVGIVYACNHGDLGEDSITKGGKVKCMIYFVMEPVKLCQLCGCIVCV